MSEHEPTARELLAVLQQAWNAGDGPGYGAPFSDDADFVDLRGSHHRGAVAIGDGHQGIFDSSYKGSTVRYELVSARALTPDIFLAHATAHVDGAPHPMPPNDGSMVSFVAVRTDDTWRIRAFHNTVRMKQAPRG